MEVAFSLLELEVLKKETYSELNPTAVGLIGKRGTGGSWRRCGGWCRR
jgi:hypothetical protein